MEKFIVSARKYRPNNFLSLIGQESIATTLKNSIKRDQLAHAYLFCGPRGVGKTSTARIFAKTINCLNPSEELEPCGECESCRSFAEGRSYCIHELDAASNNSVDDIRLLTEKVRIPPQIGKYSVYIIDEVHMLSSAAFNAFLKTLEEPPAHAIFILATTEKHKILPTILSRCQTYDFNRISIEDIVKNLSDIAVKEGITIDSDSLHVIAQKADGAMRDALTLFDQTVAFCGTEVEYSAVIKNLNVLDYDYYFNIIECALAGNFAKALVLFDQVLGKGFNALYFVGGLSSHLRNLLVCKDSSTLKLLEMAPTLVEKYKEQSGRCGFKFLYEALAHTVKCEADYRLSNNQRLLVEFLLIRLSQSGKPQEQQIAAQQQVEQAVAKHETAVQPDARLAQPAQGVQPEQPSVQPVQSKPASAVPHAQSKSAGLSIKNIMQQSKKTAESNAAEVAVVHQDKAVTKESLFSAWSKLGSAKVIEPYPRLVTAIRQTEPLLDSANGDTIVFPVSNSAQKVWIEKNAILLISKFMQDELDNKSVKIIVNVKEVQEQDKKLYMPHEKAEFLLSNNPELQELKKDLDLDLE